MTCRLRTCRWPAILVGVASALVARSSQADPAGSICTVFRTPLDGVEPGALDAALVVEARKLDLVIDRVIAASTAECPTGEAGGAGMLRVILVVGATDGVLLLDPDGGTWPIVLTGVAPADRSQEVARHAMARLADLGRGAGVPIGVVAPAPETPGGEPGPQADPRGYVQIGGAYAYAPGPGMHHGAVEAEGGAWFFGERLGFGALLGWQPPESVPGSASGAGLQAIDFLGMVRGGLRVDPVWLRLGLGAGLEWRRFAFGGDVGTVRTSTVPAIAAEAEVAIGLVAGLRLSAAAQVRGFPDGTTWVHGGRTLYDAPRVAAGFAVRLGWVFGGEP